MNPEQVLRESILKRLKQCGVPVSKLHLSVDADQIEVSGSVDSFYSLQLIQSQLRTIGGGRKLIQQVLVALPREHTFQPNLARRRTCELGLEA